MALALLAFPAVAQAETGHTDNEPCLAISSVPPAHTHLRISKTAAAYVVRHIQNACRSISQATSKGAPLEDVGPALKPVIAELDGRILAPISRLHPDVLANIDSTSPPKKIYRATKKDISRSTALWLTRELLKAHAALVQGSSDLVARKANQNFDGQVEEAYLSVVTEVLAASTVISDAYPAIWNKELSAAAPRQVRTAESDAGFRKGMPPRGSVSLTAAALAQIKSFMRQARKTVPKDDLVASIGWATGQKSKGPEDKAWTSIPDGLLFGTYLRSQVPPDVIDHVGGIEIIFTNNNIPDRLTGKTIDFQKGAFVIRD